MRVCEDKMAKQPGLSQEQSRGDVVRQTGFSDPLETKGELFRNWGSGLVCHEAFGLLRVL